MGYYRKTEDMVFQEMKSQKEGISKMEARKRLKKYGRNKLEKKKEKSIWKILLEQVMNPVIYLLIAATVVSFVFGDIPEGIAIMIVIVLNTGIGFWMEYQARQSMKALKEMDKLMTRVIRDGQEKKINAEEIVPGDVLVLEAGDLVAADARVFEESDLSADESPLTGESVPVSKDTDKIEEEKPVGDRKNMVFKGTSIVNGKGLAVVTATGMNTQLGEISRMLSETSKDKIPLNRKLTKLTHVLIWVILGLAALYLGIGWAVGEELYLLIQTAIAWSIAAIPEGLPVVASIALARGMLRLSRQNVIVKKLASVETLGETTIIFTDKTGTLTENNLSVSSFLTTSGRYDVDEENSDMKDDPAMPIFEKILVLNNNASIGEDKKGDPLEIALLEYMKARDENKYKELQSAERKHEDPFDSESKRMGTIHRMDDKLLITAKGAADAILERSDRILEDDKPRELTPDKRKTWTKKNKDLSSEGLRVLALAYKEESGENKEILKKEDFLHDMIFVGLVGFIDPPREEVKHAVEECHQAGIKVAMVTGDHPETSLNIAKRVKLVQEDAGQDLVLHGSEIGHDIDDSRENKIITRSRVFARVDPGQKLDIVDHFQKHGDIVGMTGDGVNDAPALKEADIGIAMGKRGTQVAREVADMVLTDDSFPSIVKGIEQGRIIFTNIRKFIIYQLSYHLSEIILIAGISFSMFHLPVLPLQLLFLNLLSDVFPALALSLSRGDPNVMKLPPRDPDEAILTRQNWIQIVLYGVILAVFISGAYFYSFFQMDLGKDISNNVAFFTLAFSQLLHVFNMRGSNEHIFINQVTTNKYVWQALALCFGVLFAAYFIPGLQNILSFQDMPAKAWVLIAITSLLPLITIQLIKEVKKS